MAKAREQTSKTVATTQDQAQLPDFMREDLGKGMENIGQEDLEVPRLKLIQALSPEVETYNELRPGNFFHVSAEKIFTDPIRVVPIYADKRFMLWNPRDAGGGILARADDGVHWNPPNVEFSVKLDKGPQVIWRTAKTVAQSKLADWGSSNPGDPQSQPAATLMFNYLLGFPDYPDLMPAVLTFQRSSVRVGRRFNTKLKTIRAPLYGTMFELRSTNDRNKAGKEYKNLSLTGAGFVTDKDLYERYRDLNAQFAEMGLAIKDLEGLQDEGVGDNDVETETEAGKPGF